MKKIGIMGGTFNPVHLGHLLLADTARFAFHLDQVIFLPTGKHPFKDDRDYPSAEDRLTMIQLAVRDNPYFCISDIEMRREGTCYTIDTFRELRSIWPKSEFYFITGADIIMEVLKWHQAEILLKELNFITAYRPGFEDEELDRKISELERDFGAHIFKIPAAKLEIASKDIRRKIQEGLPVKYLVPQPVEDYINAHGLYGAEHSDSMTEQQMKEKLQQFLKPSRYQHTLGVVESAMALFKRYATDYSEQDVREVRLAALLHDCAKNLSSEMQLKLAEENGLVIDPVSRRSTELLHGPIGAIVAEKEFGTQEPNILNAIRYHTTGRPEMNFLEKIIFLADYIEPGRSFPGVEKLRRLAKEDLDEAIIAALTNTISFVIQSGGLLHPDTVLTRNAMIMKKMSKR